MSKHCPQSESMKALEQSLIDHMEICRLKRKAKRLQAEVSRLKSEVERLTSEASYNNRVQLHVDKIAAEFTQSEVELLKAEVERLRKAGDEVVSRIQVCTEDLWCSIHRWNAAKEGKPSV